ERNVRRVPAAAHARGERRIHRRLDARDRAEARRELQDLAAARDRARLERLVAGHVGTAEAVDRLFGIAAEEQPAADALEHVGLERVGVLALVYEDVAEPAGERAAGEEVARAQEQVEEVEPAGAALERLVAVDERAELDVERGGQV